MPFLMGRNKSNRMWNETPIGVRLRPSPPDLRWREGPSPQPSDRCLRFVKRFVFFVAMSLRNENTRRVTHSYSILQSTPSVQTKRRGPREATPMGGVFQSALGAPFGGGSVDPPKFSGSPKSVQNRTFGPSWRLYWSFGQKALHSTHPSQMDLQSLGSDMDRRSPHPEVPRSTCDRPRGFGTSLLVTTSWMRYRRFVSHMCTKSQTWGGPPQPAPPPPIDHC